MGSAKINISLFCWGRVAKKVQSLVAALIIWYGQGTAQPADTAAVRQWLSDGRARLEAGAFEEAIKITDRALNAGLTGFPLLEAEARMLRGEAAQAQGRFDLAEVSLDSAWCLVQDHAGWDHPKSAEALSDLGNYYYELGYIQTARQYHTQALAIRRRLFGDRHAETAKSYNNIANCLLSIGDYDRAIALYQAVADIREASPQMPPADLASAYNNLGSALLAAGDLPGAKKQYAQAMDLRRRTLGPDHLKTAQSHQNIGNVFAALSLQDSALRHFGEALAVYTRFYGENHPKVAAIYENMGNALAEKQAYGAAGDLQQKALRIRRQFYGPSHPDVIRSYQNIGELWMLRGDYQAALQYFRRALGLLHDQWGDYHPQVAQAQEQVGLALVNAGELQPGLNHLERALALRQALFGVDHPYVAGTAMNLGNAYWQDGQYQQARDFYRRSLEIWSAAAMGWEPEQLKAVLNISRTYLEENRPALAQQALNLAGGLPEQADSLTRAGFDRTLGEALLEQGLYQPADRCLDDALKKLGFRPETGNEPGKASLEILLCLHGKARNYLEWARSSSDRQRADTALIWFEKAFNLLTKVQDSYLNPEARQRMTALNTGLFAGAIDACFMLADGPRGARYRRLAFAFSDRNKSIRLMEANRLQRQPAQGGTDILVSRLQQLTRKINDLEKERAIDESQLDDEDRRAIDRRLFDLQQQKADLYRNLESAGTNLLPESLFLTEDSIKIIQRSLAPDQAMMAFFTGEKAKYQFVLTGDTIAARRLDPAFPLQQAVTGMAKSLLQYPGAPSGEKPHLDSVYTAEARRLYELLFSPVAGILGGKRSLVIVPDGILGWLPFEALLTSDPETPRRYRTYPYLLSDCTISYTYSGGYWLSLKQLPVQSARPARSCLALAPDFATDPQGFAPLEHNAEEASSIARMLRGKVLKGVEATRANFLALAPNYAVLHLATHAKSNSYNGDYAYMAFSANPKDSTDESLLYVKDLYGQRWHADLAVLSACETGIGSFRPGEGVISLGRGFAQAGVRSTVNSLWSVNDARTSDLMQGFYTGLRKGLTKDDALRQAKLTYLAGNAHEAAHPFYWASYLPFGDMAPLKLPNPFPWSYLLIGILLAAGVFYLVRKLI